MFVSITFLKLEGKTYFGNQTGKFQRNHILLDTTLEKVRVKCLEL